MDIISLALINKLKGQVSTLATANITNVELNGSNLTFTIGEEDTYTVTLPTTDTTLSNSGSPADAATVGAQFTQLINLFEAAEETTSNSLISLETAITTLDQQTASQITTISNALLEKASTSDITNLQTLINEKTALHYDAAPTLDSPNLVNSGDLYNYINAMLLPLEAIIGPVDTYVDITLADGTVHTILVPEPNFATDEEIESALD